MLLSDHPEQVFRPAFRSENLAKTSSHEPGSGVHAVRTHAEPTGGIASALLHILPTDLVSGLTSTGSIQYFGQ